MWNHRQSHCVDDGSFRWNYNDNFLFYDPKEQFQAEAENRDKNPNPFFPVQTKLGQLRITILKCIYLGSQECNGGLL